MWCIKLCSKGFSVCISSIFKHAFVYKAIEGYTRLRGMLGKEAPTFCDACFLSSHAICPLIFWKRKVSKSQICSLMSSTLLSILDLSGHHGSKHQGIEKLLEFPSSHILGFFQYSSVLVAFTCLGNLLILLESVIALLWNFTNQIKTI